MVFRTEPDLWSLVLDQHQIAPLALAEAIAGEMRRKPLDFRTRLLIRDSLNALERGWGRDRLNRWLEALPESAELATIRNSVSEPPGFASLEQRIMEPTRVDTVVQFLRELGQSLKRPTQIIIGGSVALILPGALSRRTEDIDVVDEVPVQIRSEHELLESLARRYALRLTHFQSHYLPTDWLSRVQPLGMFGRLEVSQVDVYDVVASKVFSTREKDRDDLRFLAPRIEKQKLVDRIGGFTASLRAEPKLREYAEKNWYIVYGEPLPA